MSVTDAVTNSRGQVVRIFGLPLNALRMSEVVEIAEQHIVSRQQLLLGVVNVAKVVNSLRDAGLRRSLEEADLILADGLPIVWLSRMLGSPLPERVAGIDIMNRLLERSNAKHYRVYFLGAKSAVVRRVVDIVKEVHPGLRVAGYRDGYFREDQEHEVSEAIRRSHADIVFVAMNSPKKENFLSRWYKFTGVPVCHGVGGGFDVLAGVTKRGPRWMQRFGLEWLYRLVQEPRRLWKRYLVTNSIFLVLSLSMIVRSRIARLLSAFSSPEF